MTAEPSCDAASYTEQIQKFRLRGKLFMVSWTHLLFELGCLEGRKKCGQHLRKERVR